MTQFRKRPSVERPPAAGHKPATGKPRGKPKPVDELPRPVRGRPDLAPGPGGTSRGIGPDLGGDTAGDGRPPRLPGNKI